MGCTLTFRESLASFGALPLPGDSQDAGNREFFWFDVSREVIQKSMILTGTGTGIAFLNVFHELGHLLAAKFFCFMLT